MTRLLRSEQDTIELAGYYANLLKPGDIVFLYGDLGSGKTFFTRALAQQLGCEDPVTSPTFVLHNRYTAGKKIIHHLDLYRLKTASELIELGVIDEMEEGITLIEWPELAAEIIPDCSLELHFRFADNERSVEITEHFAR